MTLALVSPPDGAPITDTQLAEREKKCAEVEAHMRRVAEAEMARARNLSERLEQLQGEADKLPDDADALAPLVARAAALPTLDLSPSQERARQARLQAVMVREQACEAMQRAAALFGEELKTTSAHFSALEAAIAEAKSKPAPEPPPAPVRNVETPHAETPYAEPATPPPAAKAPPPVPLDASGKRLPLTPPKRNQERVQLQAAIDFTSENNIYAGFSTNISEGGLFIATVELLEVGTAVELKFTLPDNHVVSATGEVRWTREVSPLDTETLPGMGIAFQTIDPDSLAALSRFVSTREPLFFPD